MGNTGARPNINSNGVNLVESFLLVRYVNRMDLRCTSQSLTNFTMALVSVWFIRSSRPLDWGWYAKLILWSVPHNLNSSSLTLLTNSRPWSNITISATLYLVIRSYRKSATPRGPIYICLLKQVEFKLSLNFDRGLASFVILVACCVSCVLSS